MVAMNFPHPYPEELLYSVIARYAVRVGFPRVEDIPTLLFGSHTSRAVIDFPVHLDYLQSQLPKGLQLTTEDILDKHTLLPFYGAFFSTTRKLQVRQRMREGKNSMGLIAKLNKGVNNLLQHLRFCPLCIESDRISLGECYWRRVHQIESVLVCPDHEVFLEESSVQVLLAGSLKRFVTAESAVKQTTIRVLERENKTHQHLSAFAKNAMSMLKNCEYFIDDLNIRYRFHLQQQGLSTMLQTFSHAKLVESIKEHFSDELLQMIGCSIEERVGGSWPVRLLHQGGRTQPTLHHLIMIRFLGHSPETFLGTSTDYNPYGTGPWPCLNPVCEHYRKDAIHACILYPPGSSRPNAEFVCECGFTYVRIWKSSNDSNRFKGKITKRGYLWEQELRKLWLSPEVVFSQIGQILEISDDSLYLEVGRLGLSFERPTLRFRFSNELSPKLQLNKSQEDCQAPTLEEIQRYREILLATIDASRTGRMAEIYRKCPNEYNKLQNFDSDWLKAQFNIVLTNQKILLPSLLERHKANLMNLLRERPSISLKEIKCCYGKSYDRVRKYDEVWLHEHVHNHIRSRVITFQEIEGSRKVLLEAIKNNPSISRAELSSQYRTAYIMLLKHDQEWLEQQAPRQKRISSPNGSTTRISSVNWHARDAELSQQVQTAAQTIRGIPGKPIRVTIKRIFNELGLSRPISIKQKIPLTMEVLAEVTERTEQFVLRRIIWKTETYLQEGKRPSTRRIFVDAVSLRNYSKLPAVQSAIDEAMKLLNLHGL